ncbi:acetylxylan esterase [Protaetiibacter mangrovi]|uniref:Acetylxylan esterase n=1 Tax=Protaetiibacter mangrovi TaxID=2970926 RepID=A0ABT1ZGN5_9MICO|nr:acetylxylan esterase [Protaetiibacter mangrovi]MCS0499888.1 acetylxylan esterase [Protaetiibacter mangrovi]TPW91278.1 acetylxylan esterase [Schumannella luteola]
MALFDLPLDELEHYAPRVPVQPDFDEFWSSTLAEARLHDLAVALEPVDNGLAVIDTFDVSFAGFAGDRVRAWLHLPRGASGRLPVIVEFAGYGSGRGLAHQNTIYAQAGYAHLVTDNRGQGQWTVGDTPDPSPASGTGPIGGYLTRGITAPGDHYYRRLFTDAVRAVDAVATLANVDASRIMVAGASQGGAIALAAAALHPAVFAAMIDIPFLCHVDRAVRITDRLPYREVVDYLARYRDREGVALRTLSYFDGANFAPRITTEALYSVALMDTTCPPSTVYAAYNAHAGPKEIAVYPFNDHEGGGEFHRVRQLEWLGRVLSRPSPGVTSS